MTDTGPKLPWNDSYFPRPGSVSIICIFFTKKVLSDNRGKGTDSKDILKQCFRLSEITGNTGNGKQTV